MKVIGAGLPRTATTTQAIAFERLGFGHCYHMRDLMMDMETGFALWEAASRGERDWDTIFGDAESTVDWPGGRYYKELLEYYPDSKVVLSVRSPEGWVQSMRETIWPMYFGDSVMHHMCAARAVLDPVWRRFMDLMICMSWDEHTGCARRRPTRPSTTMGWPRRWIAGTSGSSGTSRPIACSSGSRARAGSRCASSSRWTCPTSRSPT